MKNNSKERWWLLINRDNSYFDFIERCKVKAKNLVKTNKGDVHVHHILPIFLFNKKDPEERAYMDSEENKVLLTVQDHIEAHSQRYNVYQDRRDLGAMDLLKGNMEKATKFGKQAGAKATHQILKERRANFWSSEDQRENARKSVAKDPGGKMRSKAGKIGGRNRNRNIAINAKDRFIFYYKKEAVLCIINCETGGEVLDQLKQTLTGQKVPLPNRVTQLLKGNRKTALEWSCTKLNNENTGN